MYTIKKSFINIISPKEKKETLSSLTSEFGTSFVSATQLRLQIGLCNPDFILPYSTNIFLPTCFTRKEWNYFFSNPEVCRRGVVADAAEPLNYRVNDEIVCNKYTLEFLINRNDKIHYWRGGDETRNFFIETLLTPTSSSEFSKSVTSKNLDLSEFLTKEEWEKLSIHPNAIRLLTEHYMEYIDWWKFSTNPGAIPFLEKNPDKIKWLYLSLNPNALHLLEKHYNEIAWTFIERNYGFYDVDYELIEKRTNVYKKELIENALHPRRVARIYDIIGDDCEIEKYI